MAWIETRIGVAEFLQQIPGLAVHVALRWPWSRAVRVEAEAAQLGGGAVLASGRWASGGSYVGYLGKTAAS